MTCSGCEAKLRKALEKIPSIENIRTDLVLSTAQFSVDTRTISANDALLQLQRMTAYSFERIIHSEGLFLDILVDSPEVLCGLALPFGALRIDHLGKRSKEGKTVVRIYYDPARVYPRDLLEKGFGIQDIQLAPIPPNPSIIAGRKQVRKEFTYFVISALLTVPVLIFAWAPIPGSRLVYNAISLGLATVVQAGLAWEFYPSAFRSLIHSKTADMDLLIVLSTSTACIFSIVVFSYYAAGHPLSVGSFFETSTLLVTLIRLGRFVSEIARQKATESVSIKSLQAPTAFLLSKHRTVTREIDARLLQHGDDFRVLPHSRIPTDGVVIYGGSQVDESTMTGESKPVAKGIGSSITAGTLNLDGTLDAALSRMPFENSISEIGAMVENAELSKPKSQAMADRIAGYFVPAIIAIACIVFTVWLLIGTWLLGLSASNSAIEAAKYAIATLIISCPCAIGLAVPMVIVIASGHAAKHSVVFSSPPAIEASRKVSHVIFDKTGTLTQGKMTVIFELCDPTTSSHVLGLVSANKHPISIALSKHLEHQSSLQSTKFKTLNATAGGGIEGRLDGLVVRGGSYRWLGVEESEVHGFVVSRLKDAGRSMTGRDNSHLFHSTFAVTVNEKLAALFALEDVLRPEAAQVISKLRSQKITVSLVSGDEERAVQRIAQFLNIAPANTRSRCSPQDKQEYVRDAQRCNGGQTVMFCGDGTNDAVALMQANVGVHMGGGTDVAKSCADVALVRPDLRGILIAMDLSRRAVRRIWFNFVWAAGYNTLAVLLAAGAFVKVHGAVIPPQFAGLGEIASVVPVILVAFSLKFSK
ncbi:uncharacterized protein K452DRAFT_259972, partial [Aplosporella prunicola CBS 121167]